LPLGLPLLLLMKTCVVVLGLSSVLLTGLAHAADADPTIQDDAPTATPPAPAEPVAAPAEALEPAAAEPVAAEPMAPEPMAPSLPAVLLAPSGPASAEHPVGPAKKDDDRGPLGPFRLGALAGVGAPAAFSGELLLKYRGWVGLAADYGRLPTVKLPFAGDGVSLQQTQLGVAARVYPFHGAFFVGCGFGTDRIDASVAESSGAVRAAARASAERVNVVPQVGFLYRFSFGLAIGADVGVAIPVASSSSIHASANGTAQEVPSDLRAPVAFLESTPMPILNVLRLGYVL